jgi:hypothetical protein
MLLKYQTLFFVYPEINFMPGLQLGNTSFTRQNFVFVHAAIF